MAITLEQQHTLATDMNFVNRVRQSMLTIALKVLVETEADYALYQSRQSLALRVLNSPINESKRIAYALATVSPAATQEAILDAPLVGFLRSNWTLFSGYNANAPVEPAP